MLLGSNTRTQTPPLSILSSVRFITFFAVAHVLTAHLIKVFFFTIVTLTISGGLVVNCN
jgi:hypothetical protein